MRSFWEVARSLLSEMGIERGTAARVAWELLRAEHEGASLYRRTDRLDRAREVAAGMRELARQVVAAYPDDPYAHLAESEAFFEVSKNAWRDAGPREVADALGHCVDAARRAVALDPRNADAQAALADRQQRLADLRTP